MTINERIKEIRNKEGITQQAFANRVKLKRGTIASYEVGLLEPSDRTIKDICDEFHINEEWLRTGEGEMQSKNAKEDAERMVRLTRDMSENKKKLFRILVDMPDELLDEMISYIKKEIN